MNELDPISPADYFVYKLLSAAGGKDLKQAHLEELRQRRKDFIEEKDIMGGPPFHTERIIETLIDMGLEEAEHMPDFEPDMLIVTIGQYRKLSNIGLGVPLNPDKAHHTMDKQGLATVQPPLLKDVGEYSVDVVYSDKVDGMLLVDSSALSETKYL